MQLGYSVTSFFTADVAPSSAAEAVLERAGTAVEAGYDVVEVGDHHAVGPDAGYLQNVPTAARLTEVVDRVGVMFLLPLHHPVLVAEQVGTLAALAESVELWCAVGGGAEQFDAMGVPLAERGARMEEALELIRRLWSEDGVTYDGEFYAVEDASVSPGAPDARICIGGSAEAAVRRAGRLGDAWVVTASGSPAHIERARGWFEDAGGGDVVVRRDVLALENGERARRLAREKLEAGYRGWSPDADWVLAGHAEDVAAGLADLESLGADEVVVRPMSDTHALETLEVVAEARARR